MLEPTIFKNNSEIETFLSKHWDIKIPKVQRKFEIGSANLYLIADDNSKFVLKEYESDVYKEDIQKEIDTIHHLKVKGLPVAEYFKTISGFEILDLNGRLYTLMSYIDGTTPENNTLRDELMIKVSNSLAKLNLALEDFNLLETWNRVDDSNVKLVKLTKLISHNETLNIENKQVILDELQFKLKIFNELIERKVEIKKFTHRNSNGDFSARQLLFDNDENVVGFLDFDRASNLPISWEIIRSYTQGSMYSKDGDINLQSLCGYVKEYMKLLSLSKFDLENMAYIYLLQLAPTTHGYNPDLYTLESTKIQTHKFGRWRTAIVKSLYENEKEISNALVNLL